MAAIGRERKRSTMPLSMSLASPSAVKAELKVTARAKMPPMRNVRYSARHPGAGNTQGFNLCLLALCSVRP